MEPRKYHFNNSTLSIIFGDITQSEADVIVSSDDTWISMGGGVSKSIRVKGGEIIRNDAQKKLPAQLGDVVVSTAGALQHQKYIFHCLTLSRERKNDLQENDIDTLSEIQRYILQHSVDKCFNLLHALEINSIAFPCIGAGVARFPINKVAEIMADVISANLCKTNKQFNIELYLYDRNYVLSEFDYIDVFEHFAVKSALAQQDLKRDIDSYNSDVIYSETTQTSVDIPQREEMHHSVFISYSRKDKDFVEDIVKLLDENSIPYWIDKEGIYSGENYKEVIVDAIESSRVVIFVSSQNSNSSINVIRELGFAVKQNKTIIPIVLDDAPYAKSIRLDIGDIDQIEYRTPLKDSKLIPSIKYVLETRY